MTRFAIGTKILMVIGISLVLFMLGLAYLIGTTSSNNLADVKQAELTRMSQILASQIVEQERNAARAGQSLEANEQTVAELQQITLRGPYYAEPGSFIEPAEFATGDTPIEDADQTFNFQSSLNLIELLQTTQRINNFSSITYYQISPFEMLPNARPLMGFHLDNEYLFITRFTNKGDPDTHTVYRVHLADFIRLTSEDFDVSSVYSLPAADFYAEANFAPVSELPAFMVFEQHWIENAPPRSQIILREGVPVIQTWYTVQIPMADPESESWDLVRVGVGIIQIEQTLDTTALAALKEQLGLDVGFAQGTTLLISSLSETLAEVAIHPDSETVEVGGEEFYYATEEIVLNTLEPATLSAVALSPRAELDALTEDLQSQILRFALLTISLTALIVYFGIQYLVNRPLHSLTQGVQLISAGNLDQRVPVQSQDELGELARAFNTMAAQLQDLITSLEQRVEARTSELKAANAAISKRARQMEASNLIGQQITSHMRLDKLLDETVRLIQDRFGYYFVGFWLLSPQRDAIVLKAGATHNGHKPLEADFSIPLQAHSIVGMVSQSGDNYLAPDVHDDPIYLALESLPQTRSELVLPLRAGTETFGVLDIQANEVNGFDHDDQAVLQSLANQIGIAIRNAQLFSEAQAALETAEQANRVKSMFLASMSHELRTPLNGIMNFIQFVSLGTMGEVNEMQVDLLNKALGNSEHLLSLINDILDISKIESGSLKLFVEDDVNLPELLDGVVATGQSLLLEKRVELRKVYEPNLPLLLADKRRIRQIILNLVSNACKFTEEGSITVRAMAQGDDVIISVQDTGQGIALEDQAAIFEAFRQTHTGLKQGEGTGLGLTISRRLTEAHGGRMWLESTLGKGSTFYVQLPIKSEFLTPTLK